MNLNMISNYVKAKWSKGIGGKKVDITTKDIRLLSCFGNGEGISVCPGLRPSEKSMGKFICGECGCGDGEGKYLNEDEGKYAKLDHPYLSCPRKMPGFTDYVPATDEDALQEKRKKMIEITLGGDIVNNQKLIKPMMSEKEIQEAKQKEKEHKHHKEGDCPKCRAKKELRETIIKEFEDAGEDIDFKKEEFREKYQRIFKERMEIIELDTCEDHYSPFECEKKRLSRQISDELERVKMEKGTEEWKINFIRLWKERYPQLMSTPLPEND